MLGILKQARWGGRACLVLLDKEVGPPTNMSLSLPSKAMPSQPNNITITMANDCVDGGGMRCVRLELLLVMVIIKMVQVLAKCDKH